MKALDSSQINVHDSEVSKVNPKSDTEVLSEIDKLVDGWCERRSLKPLRYMLRSFPLANGLTDNWGDLLESLKDIKGLCGSELTGEERNLLLGLINALEPIVYHQK